VHGSRVVICLVTLAALCACSASSSSSSSTATTSPTATATSASCPTTDEVKPGLPVVQISPSGGAVQTITKPVPLTCYTTLTVGSNGGATATFGKVASCTLSKGSSTGGLLVSRYPPGTFFSLIEGEVICFFNAKNQVPVMMCNMVMLLVSGQPSVLGSCSAHRLFVLWVHSGSVRVKYPHGSMVVGANGALTFNYHTGAATPGTASFKPAQLAVINQQARALGVSIGGT
jgi:hypothetical protein